MFFQTTASNAGEPIETSTIASFDANYSGSKTDEIRILVVWSNHASSSPTVVNDESTDDDSRSLAMRTMKPPECLFIRI
jgi:hypothetical protein